jgi:hypothetical protein
MLANSIKIDRNMAGAFGFGRLSFWPNRFFSFFGGGELRVLHFTVDFKRIMLTIFNPLPDSSLRGKVSPAGVR